MKQTYNDIRRTKPVQNPSAQPTSKLHQGMSIDTKLDSFILTITSDSTIPAYLKGLILLILCHGIRVSELLCIVGKDILTDGTVKIRGLKGSNDRIIEPYYFRKQISGLSGSNFHLGACFSRWWFYRYFKKRGIYIKFKSGQNASVTHVGRVLYAKKIQGFTKDKELTKRSLGHKNIKNTEIYINKK